MSENAEIKVAEVEEEKTVETKENIGSKVVRRVKKHWKVIAGVAVAAGCSDVAYKYGVKAGIKSGGSKPIVDAVAEGDIDRVVENIVQETDM